jgi:hypothetical protein
MDDSVKQAQNQDDGQQNTQQSHGAGSAVQQDAQQPSHPVSGPHKEAAPLSGQTGEYLQPTETKAELSQEVVEAGVEHVPDEKPHIPHEVAQAGVVHAKETIAHHTEPVGVVSLPSMTQQQAIILKKNPVRDAARWLAVLVLRQFDKIAYQKLPTK